VQNVKILAAPARRSTLCTYAVRNVDPARRIRTISTFCTHPSLATHTDPAPLNARSTQTHRTTTGAPRMQRDERC
jgi:hypothetical protein